MKNLELIWLNKKYTVEPELFHSEFQLKQIIKSLILTVSKEFTALEDYEVSL